MRILIDMNLSPEWVDRLADAGIGDVVVRTLISFREDLHEGALITIEPGRTRSRLLPLRDRPA